ncbi:MAG TPA: C40 family peptidase [Ktedonobacteraceae bacterium]|nr:C40 family peptidase [Ktedonobacteraceae bacterium]
MTTYAISTAVANVHRDPDSTSELVTQALMNMTAVASETSGDWTHITLPDYSGWVHTHQLEEPIARSFCKVGETCNTPLPLFAVVTTTRTPLYENATGNATVGTAYLSTALPLLDTMAHERVQVALPGEDSAWLDRTAIAVREHASLYSRSPIRAVTTHARSFLNVPYLWGGTSYEGIDCSGFVQLCYRMGGYIIPRDADQQHDFLSQSVQRPDLREGDLIFFGAKAITHVGMALNDHEYIHAEGQNYNHVVINSFHSADPHYYPRLDNIVWAIKRVV